MTHTTNTSGRAATRRGRRGVRLAAWVTGLAIGVSGVGGAMAAQASATPKPYCGITWGSLAKDAAATRATDATTTGVRAGRHACFDRFVVDGASWARVRYVSQVREDGSGNVVPLRGGARLEIITTTGIDTTGAEYRATFLPPRSKRANLVDVTGYRTFRQVAYAGDFEGQLTLGAGVRARLPFRVFVLRSPGRDPRVVIDVAHRW
jgi:hypothetical protein